MQRLNANGRTARTMGRRRALVVIGAAAVAGCTADPETDGGGGDAPTETESPRPAVEGTLEEPPSMVEVLDHQLARPNGAHEASITGTVEHTGEREISLMADGTFYRDNTQIGEGAKAIGDFRPGDRWEFEVHFPGYDADAEAVNRYVLEFDAWLTF